MNVTILDLELVDGGRMVAARFDGGGRAAAAKAKAYIAQLDLKAAGIPLPPTSCE